MKKLNIAVTTQPYDKNYIDWCKKENIDPDPFYYDTVNKKVEGGEIAMAEKINEIVEFLNNLKK